MKYRPCFFDSKSNSIWKKIKKFRNMHENRRAFPRFFFNLSANRGSLEKIAKGSAVGVLRLMAAAPFLFPTPF